jgi:phosphoribosylamine--glycine ligase
VLELLWKAARGEALPAEVAWEEGACVGVVLASRGYPASSSKGDVIAGLSDAAALTGVEVFHAGTALQGEEVVTAGGRVLAVTGRGATFAEARALAYAAVERIAFPGMQHRRDIALRAEEWERSHHGDRP